MVTFHSLIHMELLMTARDSQGSLHAVLFWFLFCFDFIKIYPNGKMTT